MVFLDITGDERCQRGTLVPGHRPRPSGRPVSVLILDRQRTFADAVATWLEARADVAVLAAVSSAQSARQVMIGRRIDVAVVDGELPDRTALAFCADICGHRRSPGVVILSVSAAPERIVAALRAGAAAWVCRDEPMQHLLSVILGVADGEVWIPPSCLGRVIEILLRKSEQASRGDDLLSSLTHRERDVLSLIAHGLERKQVAEQLHLSPNTVRTHMQNLLAKLGVHSAVEAVALTRSQLGRARRRTSRD